MTQVARTLAAAVLVALAGCGGEGGNAGREAEGTETGAAPAPADTAVSNELQVEAVMIGKRIGQNNLITEPTFQFAPTDTVYISVSSTGAPDSARIATLWRFQTGEVLDSTAKTIQPEGEDATEFRLASAKGLKVGTYNVTVYADGDSVDSKNFAVKK